MLWAQIEFQPSSIWNCKVLLKDALFMLFDHQHEWGYNPQRATVPLSDEYTVYTHTHKDPPIFSLKLRLQPCLAYIPVSCSPTRTLKIALPAAKVPFTRINADPKTTLLGHALAPNYLILQSLSLACETKTIVLAWSPRVCQRVN